MSIYGACHGFAPSTSISLGTLGSALGLYSYHALSELIAAFHLAKSRFAPTPSPSLSLPL